ncbi:hypothetical protein TNIN_29401 [Trichonephila inaurata madagascariensis]|uniref:CCHC-type domain-containing protein n=1 Tax=Trichonephila inaurata madagascariensis TaxID=2747483 RepID=A0A8X6YDU9_9ARAC|nr:hypothetical protein TNIN_29401 [Trichonephila inaurata madagascariensis]
MLSIKSLPSKFDSIVQNILRWTDETFKYKDILSQLVAEETRIDFRDDLSLQRSQHKMFSVQKSKIKCHYCGKFGHFRRECRKGSTTASSSTTNRRYREYKTSPKLRRHSHVPHLLGLLCQVTSSIVILFEVVDETETVHLRT